MSIPDRANVISASARAAFMAGTARCAPVAFGVLVYGLIFGALAQQAGLSLGETAFMNAIVYSGSAQFVALGLWSLPPPLLALAVTIFSVNFRFFLIAATMHPVLRGWPRWRALAALFWVSDENWAVTMAAGERPHWGAFYLGTGWLLWVAWLSAGLLGHSLGAVVPDPKSWGLDFAFTAVFLALATGLARRRKAPLVWIASAGAALLADRFIGGSAPVLVGGLAGAIVAALRSGAGAKHAR
jgi:predicted branched-subunit amino acid permease